MEQSQSICNRATSLLCATSSPRIDLDLEGQHSLASRLRVTHKHTSSDMHIQSDRKTHGRRCIYIHASQYLGIRNLCKVNRECPGFAVAMPLRAQCSSDSPQNIQQINITVRCPFKRRLVIVDIVCCIPYFPAIREYRYLVLKCEFTVWDKSMDDPLHSGNTDGTQKKKIETRLVAGRHIFPFSFPFPTQTDPITTSSVLDDNSIFTIPYTHSRYWRLIPDFCQRPKKYRKTTNEMVSFFHHAI